jgi:hypothetical protein
MQYNEQLHRLTTFELALVQRFLTVEFQGREEIGSQIKGATGRWLTNAEAPALIIRVSDTCALANVNTRVSVDGVGHDEDGSELHFLFHVVDGKAAEIEIFRPDGGKVRKLPQPSTISVMAY